MKAKQCRKQQVAREETDRRRGRVSALELRQLLSCGWLRSSVVALGHALALVGAALAGLQEDAGIVGVAPVAVGVEHALGGLGRVAAAAVAVVPLAVDQTRAAPVAVLLPVAGALGVLLGGGLLLSRGGLLGALLGRGSGLAGSRGLLLSRGHLLGGGGLAGSGGLLLGRRGLLLGGGGPH